MRAFGHELPFVASENWSSERPQHFVNRPSVAADYERQVVVHIPSLLAESLCGDSVNRVCWMRGIRYTGWQVMLWGWLRSFGSGRDVPYSACLVICSRPFRSQRCILFSSLVGFNVEPCLQTALWSLAESNFPSICFD